MPTLKDVAKLCGLSTATVSYVLNNSDRQILPSTRERVLKAIAEIGYQPNAYARALKGVRHQVIGVIFPHVTVPFTNVYFGPLLEGIVSATTERRLATMLFTGLSWEECEQGAQRRFNGICDGYLLVAPKRHSGLGSDLTSLRVPYVTVGGVFSDAESVSIDADNRLGGRLAAERLLSLGHRRIGIVLNAESPDPESESDRQNVATSSVEREEGFLEAIRAAGLDGNPDLVATNSHSETQSRDSIATMLRRGRPTAVFACNDGAAYRAIEVGRELGLRVPEDLSVIGFDDIPSSATFQPPLTTIRQPIAAIGARAVELLCEQIEGRPTETGRVAMPVELIDRGSTQSLY